MYPCPSCEREFETQRGLRVHHMQTHDDPLPNRTCSRCEEEFYSRTEQKYCSQGCRDEAVQRGGSNHPRYSGGKETTECDICGAAFQYYASEKKGLYCGTCVEEESWRHRPDITGEDNPRWAGGRRELRCDECGGRVFRERSNINSDRVFCSPECQYDWLSEAFTGDGHPNWKGGGEANYGPGWRRVRERALERDGYTCVVCGASSEELGRNPDVHHIVPVRRFVETPVTTKRDAHYLENVVALCIACHRRAEHGTISPERLRMAVEAGVD